MRRGRQPKAAGLDLQSLENELAQLKARQTEIRRQLRERRSGGTVVRKLEAKLEKQLASAKWTVRQIQELQPGWDDVGFYRAVEPQRPTPRGRRPRAAAGE